MIYEVNGEFVISSRHVWLSGCYADRRAANYAFRFSDETLYRLSEIVKPASITFKMLQKARREGNVARIGK